MKRNIRKIIYLLVASICISAAAGCGKNNNTTQSVKLPDDAVAAEAMQQPKREVNEAELIPFDDIVAEDSILEAEEGSLSIFKSTDRDIIKPFKDAMDGDESLNNYQAFVNFGMSIAPEGIDTYSSKSENSGSLSRIFTDDSANQKYTLIMTDMFAALVYDTVFNGGDIDEYLPCIEELVRQASNIDLSGSEYWSSVCEKVKSGDVRYPVMIDVRENVLMPSNIRVTFEQNGFSVAAMYMIKR